MAQRTVTNLLNMYWISRMMRNNKAAFGGALTAFCFVLLSCGLPDRTVPSPPEKGQSQQEIDAGQSQTEIVIDAGSPFVPPSQTDAGYPNVLVDAGNDASGTGSTIGGDDAGWTIAYDAGMSLLLPDDAGAPAEFDAGLPMVGGEPCEASSDCFADAPYCDPNTNLCAACDISCGMNEQCILIGENQTCVCELGYVLDDDLVCIQRCIDNSICQDTLNPICDAPTGLCRGCEIGECLSADAPTCNELDGTCGNPCAEANCDATVNNYCVISAFGDSASCECVSGASPAADNSGVCLFDNQCTSNDDCEDVALPVCNDQGGCSNPCDTFTCGANEACALNGSLEPDCDCAESYYRSSTGVCISDGTCADNADCDIAAPLCQASLCVNPCDGACDDNEDCALLVDLSPSCSCSDDYQDLDADGFCEPECTITTCTENASCFYESGSPVCSCDAGYEFVGSECLDIDGCSGSPCADGVVCTDVAAPGDGYVCGDCPNGYEGTGDVCSIDYNDDCANNPCGAGGTCTDEGLNSFSCTCNEGYTGGGLQNACAVDYSDDCTPGICGAGGSCTDEGLNTYSCACADGYTGGGEQVSCSVDMFDDCANNACGVGGSCTDQGVNTFSCVCSDGYTGGGTDSPCTIDYGDDCTAGICGAGGSCTDTGVNAYSCSCANGYAGGGNNAACTIDYNDDCPSGICGAGGTCNDIGLNTYNCSCLNGYTGGGTNNPCSVDYSDDCNSGICGAGGSCADSGVNEYTCSCDSGYTGGGVNTACTVDYSDDCSPNPCANSGACSDEGVNSFSCDCPTGYTGSTCSQCDSGYVSVGGACVLACTSNSQCSQASAPICDVFSGLCEGCSSHQQCSGQQPYCSGSGACWDPCSMTNCPGSQQCIVVQGNGLNVTTSCVECLTNLDCPLDEVCGAGNTCEAPPCYSHSDCFGATPYCSNGNSGGGGPHEEIDDDVPIGGPNDGQGDPQGGGSGQGHQGPQGTIQGPNGPNPPGVCVECYSGTQCPNSQPYCSGDYECVACITNSQCSAANQAYPVCNQSSNTCEGCTSDSDCSINSTRKTCKTSNNTCVECVTSQDCAPNETCHTNYGVCFPYFDDNDPDRPDLP